MPDLADKKSEAAAAVEDAQLKDTKKKTCADCGTSKTPLWRGGPAGPMTLCNACGIRSRKKRGAAAILGSNKVHHQIKDKKSKKTATTAAATSAAAKAKTATAAGAAGGNGNGKFGLSLNQRLLALGREVLMRRSKIEKQKRMKLGEEEQAAVLLMALSYGSVYA